MTVADCLPLYLLAPGPAIALLHCGWRGIARGIVENGARRLCGLAAAPAADLSAWIGPGIGLDCYTVSGAVAARLAPQPPALLMNPRSGGPPIDLPAIIHDRLIRLGLRTERIARSAHCTSCRPELYYSHRRDRGRTGRMAAVFRIDAAGRFKGGSPGRDPGTA
jgi:YfiH family protein